MNLDMQSFYNEGAKEFKDLQDEEYQNRIDTFVKNYKKPGVKDMFDTVYDGGNIHGGTTTTGNNNNKKTGGGKKYTGGGGSGVPDQIGGNQNVGGGASYSKSAETGAKDGFGYGLKYGGLASIL